MALAMTVTQGTSRISLDPRLKSGGNHVQDAQERWLGSIRDLREEGLMLAEFSSPLGVFNLAILSCQHDTTIRRIH